MTAAQPICERLRKRTIQIRRRDGISPERVEAALREHRRHADTDDPMVVHRSLKSVVTQISAGLCVKEWISRGWCDFARTRLWGSKAKAAWKAANYLVVKGVSTPEPLAVVEERTLGGSCYLITRFEQDARPLNSILRELAAAPQPSADQAALALAVADVVGRLHAGGVYHGDLSTKNFLVKRSNGGWKVSIVDLDNIRLWRRLTHRRRLKSLAQLNDLPEGFPLRARIAFVREYNTFDSCSIDGRAMEQIARLTGARAAARNFRPPE